MKRSGQNLQAWEDGHFFKSHSRSFDLRRGLESSIYYSKISDSFKAPLVPLALPFRPTSGIRFLARDPFDDSKRPKVLYEEVFADEDDTEQETIMLPLSDINVTGREYVRVAKSQNPHLSFLVGKLGVR